MAARRWQTRWADHKAARVLAIVLLVSVAAGFVAGQGASPVRAAAFAAGDGVTVNTDFLNLRQGAGLTYAVIDVLPEGTALTVTRGRRFADDYEWYKVRTSDGTTGWVAGEYLMLAAGVGGEFAIGDTAVIDTAWLNCRVGPGLDYEVDHVMPAGSHVTVLDGPTAADGYHWYELEMENGDIAWAIGEALIPFSGYDTPSSDSVFAKGSEVVVNTDFLNLRNGAGLSKAVIEVLPGGTTLIVSNGPMTAGGYDWYEVETLDGGLGWVAGAYLAPATGGLFSVGDAVRVADGPLNLRAGPDLSEDIIRVLANNEVLLIQDGRPIVADGYTWYLVWNFGGEGWAAGEFLAIEPAGFPGEEGA
jgi:uncharacterized protein YgiM (DUF1202 family)